MPCTWDTQRGGGGGSSFPSSVINSARLHGALLLFIFFLSLDGKDRWREMREVLLFCGATSLLLVTGLKKYVGCRLTPGPVGGAPRTPRVPVNPRTGGRRPKNAMGKWIYSPSAVKSAELYNSYMANYTYISVHT